MFSTGFDDDLWVGRLYDGGDLTLGAVLLVHDHSKLEKELHNLTVRDCITWKEK